MTKYIVLDTETTNSLDDPITYDMGGQSLMKMAKFMRLQVMLLLMYSLT